MKIYLTKNDVLEILAGHFGLRTIYISTAKEGKELSLIWDEFYWEGNEEKG